MATAFDLATAILGPGVTITSATFTGDPLSADVFGAGVSPGIGIASGIVLSTGNVADIYGPNDSDNTSTNFPTAGDVDLDALVTPSATQDAAVLEFDFVPTANFLTFNYVFASEEYNEYVGSQFNDVFGFFVTDPAGVTTNIAVIPGTTTPIAVNNVNSSTNPAYYLNNDPSDFGLSTTPYNTEFDGFTTGLTAAIQVIPGEIYKFKLAIADNSDGIYDSAVFITNESFVSLPLVPVTDSFLVSSDSPTSLDVLANDLVLEGEQPLIKYFDPLSSNGGTVALDENQTPEDPLDDNLLYTPPSDFSGLDSFNYTIADSSGNTATGTVYIQVDKATPTEYEKYTFTYFYGNGDSYSGYGFAPSGTYSTGQLPDFYDNETGVQQGFYVIDSVEDGETGTNGYVYLTSYTDADTGFGTTTNLYNYGNPATYSGLGNEASYAFNATPGTGDTYFSRYYEADLPSVLQVRLNLLADNDGTPGEILANDQVGLNRSFFVQIQVGDFRGNAAGVVGLNLDFAWDGLILESINFDPSLAITSDFAFFQDGSLVYDGLIDDLSGGSLPEFEFGQAIGVNQLDIFALLHFYAENPSNGTAYLTTTVNDASLADDNPYYALDVETYQPIQVILPYSQYNFTYYYGNGDSYTGYVYAVEGTYTEGQVLGGYPNETGNEGYYEIGSIAATTLDSNFNNRVYVVSYFDGDTGFGETTNISKEWWGGNGYSGLGSEYGYAYDADGNSSDPYFGYNYEADILGNQKYNFTYYYGNGDSYTGYGYAAVGTYTAGQTIGYYPNETVEYPSGTGSVETNTLGYSFYGWNSDSVYHLTYTFTNVSDLLTLNFKASNLQELGDESWGLDNVKVTAGGFTYSNDFETEALEGWSNSTRRSTTPVGSRNFLGEFGNDTVSLSLNNADLANNPITLEFDLYILKSMDGNGNLGAGPDYFALTTSGGQTLLNTTFANYPGQFQSYPNNLPGYYVIDSVELGNTNAGYNGYVYLTSYTDADTGFGETTNLYNYGNPATYSGLGNEASYAYDADGNSSDAYFTNYYEADILNQYYTFTYTYGNGDSYSGYGYALAGTYAAGQTLEGYSNETGNSGYYTIESVEAGTTNSSENNRVYVTSYTDGDTLYGETTNLSSYGGSGLGSESGYAYTSDGSSYDAYFTNYYEADLVTAGFSITDNSGNANDSSIKFTTKFPLRKNYAESDFVRPNFADNTKYFDITNTGTGILQVYDIVSNVAGVTTNFVDDLLINPGESQRIQLTYDPSAAGENFSVTDGLILSTNALNLPQYAIALSGKSTFNSDVNYDGKVGVGDLGPLNNALKNFKNGIYDGTADINGDGLINNADLTIFNSERGFSLVA